MDRYTQLRMSENLDEMHRALSEAVTLAARAEHVAAELFRYHDFEDVPGLHASMFGDLARTVRLALIHCADEPGRVADAQYVACLVDWAYKAVLAAEVEEPVHV